MTRIHYKTTIPARPVARPTEPKCAEISYKYGGKHGRAIRVGWNSPGGWLGLVMLEEDQGILGVVALALVAAGFALAR